MMKRDRTDKAEITRREFLRKTAASTAALASFGSVLTSCQRTEEEPAKIGSLPRRTLGKTGLEVSILSFGDSVYA